MEGTVLIADDDKNIRQILNQALSRSGLNVRTTATLSTLWKWLEDGEGDVVICDVMLPDGNSLDVLPAMKKRRASVPFIVMSAQNTAHTAVRATQAGAYEYLAKPFDLREVIKIVSNLMSDENPTGTTQNHRFYSPELPIVGRSEPMQEIYRHLARVLKSDLPVLIEGETGTGKSYFADVVHKFGKFKNVPLHTLYPSRLNDRENSQDLRHLLHPATLLVERIDELDDAAQLALLNLLDEVKDFRLISTTTRDIRALVETGRFRSELYYRISVLPLELPPLRKRRDDIEELALYFLETLEEKQLSKRTFSPEALGALRKYHWPGNVKELEAFVSRLVALTALEVIDDDTIEAFLPKADARAAQQKEIDSLGRAVDIYLAKYFEMLGDELPADGFYQQVIQEVERPLLMTVLKVVNGNQLKAAKLLGINRNTLRKKMSELGMSARTGKKP